MAYADAWTNLVVTSWRWAEECKGPGFPMERTNVAVRVRVAPEGPAGTVLRTRSTAAAVIGACLQAQGADSRANGPWLPTPERAADLRLQPDGRGPHLLNNEPFTVNTTQRYLLVDSASDPGPERHWEVPRRPAGPATTVLYVGEQPHPTRRIVALEPTTNRWHYLTLAVEELPGNIAPQLIAFSPL